MITILGVQLPISEKVLYPKKTEVIMSYINAIKEGKGEAKKDSNSRCGVLNDKKKSTTEPTESTERRFRKFSL